MRVAVLGSPSFTNYNQLARALSELPVTEILTVGSNPTARQAAWYAITKGLPAQEFKADAAQRGQGSKRQRDERMIKAADLVLAFWDGKSEAVAHAIEYAHELRKRVIVVPC